MTGILSRRSRFFAAVAATAVLWLALPGCGGKSSSSTAPTVNIPAAPANLQIAASDHANSVSWNAASGATSYNLYFKVGAGATTADTKLTGVTSPYTHSALTNGTLYSYVVTAMNSAGESGASAAASATPNPTSAPAPPANLQITAGDQLNFVSWNPASGATSYNLYFKVGAGATTADTKLTGVTSPYIHSSLTNGTLYSYVVTAVNSAGESIASAEASATPTLGPIYVSVSTGDDLNDGSLDAPIKTLLRAYNIVGAGTRTILMEAGTYAETPNFQNGSDVQGGFDLPYWTLGASRTLFTNTPGSSAVVEGVSLPTAISGIAITSTFPGFLHNSIALRVLNCTSDLVFTNCRFESALASGGSFGADGAAGATGPAGAAGGNGNCDGANGGGGAGGSSGGFCTGGSGGAGGTAGGSGIGATGVAGSCVGGASGSGGAVGDPGAPGASGADGASGIGGIDGAAVAGTGAIFSNQWTPSLSDNGTPGSLGLGGGGGGGGGAQQCAFCVNGGGNGGGGGGGGGKGGGAGQGGQGGFGSFAVFLVNSSPVFISCTFQSGPGGTGGPGGAGGSGGVGGVGSLGGSACTGEIGAGGHGGHGGQGGPGGAAAGGPGGPSYCVYKVNSTPSIAAATFVLGTPGAGGPGGAHAADAGSAANGSTGLSGNTN